MVVVRLGGLFIWGIMDSTKYIKKEWTRNTSKISAMVTPDVFDTVGRIAHNFGMSKSQYVRELILEDIKYADGLFNEEMEHEFYQ